MKRSNIACFITLGTLTLIGLGLFVPVNPMMEIFGVGEELTNLSSFIGNAEGNYALKAGYILLTLFQVFAVLFGAFAMMRLAAGKEESGFVWSIVAGVSFGIEFVMTLSLFPTNALILSLSVIGLIVFLAGGTAYSIFLRKEKR